MIVKTGKRRSGRKQGIHDQETGRPTAKSSENADKEEQYRGKDIQENPKDETEEIEKKKKRSKLVPHRNGLCLNASISTRQRTHIRIGICVGQPRYRRDMTTPCTIPIPLRL